MFDTVDSATDTVDSATDTIDSATNFIVRLKVVCDFFYKKVENYDVKEQFFTAHPQKQDLKYHERGYCFNNLIEITIILFFMSIKMLFTFIDITESVIRTR